VSSLAMVAVFGGLAAGWAVQLWMVLRQSRRFHARLRELRALGTTAVGRGGSRLRGFTYVALAADGDDRTVAAEAMSGMTVFARLRPAPELIGCPLAEVAASPDSGRRARAAAQAAEAILAAPADARVRRNHWNPTAATPAPHR
jgi:DNA-binding transcriptional regulator of glucitol operon